MPLTEVPYGMTAWDWQAFIHRHTLDGYASVAAEVDANAVQAFNAFESVEGTSKHPNAVCCDGCSVVVILLKQKNPVPGDIKFTLTGPSGGFPATGSLSSEFPALPAPQTAVAGELATVTVPSVPYTVVFYRPPASYLGASNGSAMPAGGWPSVTIKATSSSGAVLGTVGLTLRPPPVLLVHGFDSGPGTWDYPPPAGAPSNSGAYPFFQSLDPQLHAVGVADYSSQNTSGLATVMPIVLDNLRSLIGTTRDNKIEDTQAGAVCHSYGGLICKCLAENAQNETVARPAGFPQFVWSASYHGPGTADTHYLRDDNDDLGYLDRVVTLGSPLDGSPIATAIINLLSGVGGNTAYQNWRIVLRALNAAGNGDALSDLAVGNPVVLAMAARPAVQWRPIVTTMVPLLQQALDQDVDGIPIVTDVQQLYGSLLQPLPGLTPSSSDGVVTTFSQTDQNYASDTSPKVQATGLFHTQEPGSQAVWTDAADLLELDNAGTVSGDYTMFKPSF
jgi:pimeloyl-ACP methyl ester carboxylesterase